MSFNSYLIICVCSMAALVSLVKSENLIVGITSGSLVYSEDIDLSAVPLKTRTKNVFYNSNNSIIRGISCVDRTNSKATAIITAGGVGTSSVNIRLKSKRGDGLDYRVQIFV